MAHMTKISLEYHQGDFAVYYTGRSWFGIANALEAGIEWLPAWTQLRSGTFQRTVLNLKQALRIRLLAEDVEIDLDRSNQ